MSGPIDDEALSAFLDGELPPERRSQVARALASNPALAERLAALAELGEGLRTLFDPVLTEPVPERLQALVAPRTATAAPVVVPLRRPAVPTWRPAALAASLALLVGVGAGWGLRAPPPQQVASLGPMAPASLQAILDSAPSGETRSLGPATEATLVASLPDPGRGWCRLFRVSDAAGPADGIACRERDGWRVVAYVALGTASAGPDDGYAPASGESRSPMRGVVADLGLGDPVDPDTEQRLIRDRWQDR
jgi:hypothetical protein